MTLIGCKVEIANEVFTVRMAETGRRYDGSETDVLLVLQDKEGTLSRRWLSEQWGARVVADGPDLSVQEQDAARSLPDEVAWRASQAEVRSLSDRLGVASKERDEAQAALGNLRNCLRTNLRLGYADLGDSALVTGVVRLREERDAAQRAGEDAERRLSLAQSATSLSEAFREATERRMAVEIEGRVADARRQEQEIRDHGLGILLAALQEVGVEPAEPADRVESVRLGIVSLAERVHRLAMFGPGGPSHGGGPPTPHPRKVRPTDLDWALAVAAARMVLARCEGAQWVRDFDVRAGLATICTSLDSLAKALHLDLPHAVAPVVEGGKENQ